MLGTRKAALVARDGRGGDAHRAGGRGRRRGRTRARRPDATSTERVTVNVVFVGFDEGDAPWNDVPPAAVLGWRADRALARVLRDRRAARARLLLRLPAVLHEPLVGGRLLLLPVVDRGREAAHRVPAGLQRAGRRARRDQQPLDRRADGREAADRHRAAGRRHAQPHDLLHQLVRAQRLQVPRLLEDRRAGSRTPATTSALLARRRARSSPGAARRPTTRRPASAAAA